MLFLAERVNIMEFNETMKINLEFDKEKEVREIVAKVYEALKIKGYDPQPNSRIYPFRRPDLHNKL